jgi:hypothetical protein
MAVIPVTQASRMGGFLGRSIFFYVKLGLMSLFVIYLLIHAILLGIQSKDFSVTLIELGQELVSPLEKAQETSLIILSGKGTTWTYWTLYYNIFWMFLWVRLFSLVVITFGLSNESEKLRIRVLALLMFLTLQMVYLAFTSQGDFSRVNIIWKSWIDIFKAVTYLFTQQKYELRFWKIFSQAKLNNSCVDSICVV